ncbi:MAG: hypothetical protein EA356_14960 [Geminicoccaceae bacterium]|nr:MAG: hypothetical protein EA356_14960 [Geminicoccaceae bacterium]
MPTTRGSVPPSAALPHGTTRAAKSGFSTWPRSARGAPMGFDANDLARERGLDGVARLVDAAEPYKAKPNGAASPLAVPFVTVDEPRRRTRPGPVRWLVQDWLAAGHLASLYGDGAAGKTLLGMQLAACTVLGRPWLGFATEAAPAVVYASEDDPDELARREHDIAAMLGCTPLDWQSRLHCISGVGRETLLCTFPPQKGGAGELTGEWHALRQRVLDERARLVVLDNAGTLYGGNENDRAAATWFLGTLAGLAKEIDGAVVLLGHPPKTEAVYSGSTAWRNRPRLLAHLKRLQDEDGNATAFSELRREKVNYGQPATFRLCWHAGAFRLDDPGQETEGERLQRRLREREALQAVVDGIATLLRRRVVTSSSRHAVNYAPKALTAEGLAAGFTKRELADALNAAIDEGRLNPAKPLWRGADRHIKTGLAPAEWTLPTDGEGIAP